MSTADQFPVRWPHKPDYAHMVKVWQPAPAKYRELAAKAEWARQRGNSDLFEGMVRRCRDLAGYAWGFDHTDAAVSEWLTLAGDWCTQWLDVCAERTPSVAAYSWVFGIGLVGGSQHVRDWVAAQDDTSGFSGGLSGTSELPDLWGRTLIALCRGDVRWLRELADRMDELLADPAVTPQGLDAYSGLPDLIRATLGDTDPAAAVTARDTIYVKRYLRGFGPNRVSDPAVFIDWDALVVAAFAPAHQVNMPASLYLPVGAIVPFPSDET